MYNSHITILYQLISSSSSSSICLYNSYNRYYCEELLGIPLARNNTSCGSLLPDRSILTVLLVEQYFKLILLLILQCVLQPSHRLLVCQLPVHEAASASREYKEQRERGRERERKSHVYEVLFLVSSFVAGSAPHEADAQTGYAVLHALPREYN